VERDAESGEPFLLWEYVDGVPFDVYTSDPARTPRELAAAMRELILAVDALHGLGIVHGDIRGANVIVDPARGAHLKLTHISPLLHHDPARDVAAVQKLLADVIRARRDEQTPLGRAILEAQQTPSPLRALATRVGNLVETSDPEPTIDATPPRGEL